jgi:hypothetical protein
MREGGAMTDDHEHHHHGHDHDHHHHGHDHDHDHGGDDIHLQIANALINFANDRIGEGHDPMEIAMGMRNAAANFTAFAVTGHNNADYTIETAADEFHQLLHHYEDRHKEQAKPMTGLEQLVEQVKNE